MGRERLFEKYLEECKNRNEWCGQGNPNAHILIIGKESYNKDLITNPIILQEKLQCQYELCKSGDFGNAKRNKNPTWSNYQLLIEKVYGPQIEFNPELFDFEKYAFTTELSSIPRKNSNYTEAKSSIKDRLLFFEKSEFIKPFPVIILACGGYIRNNDKVREIDDTFHVTFSKRYEKKGIWFCTHYDDINAPKKLVIHTWQFSLRCTKREDREWLIDEMASVIREHLDHLKKLGKI